ncbi:F-box domain-containing protein [Favolaschia claudopus]|uniref:F-box domain-containing protein n=1 Tax=Favolaschia claudopus TaxID=2862362 RepID=A0AAW0ED84_9AGAR
MDPATPDVVPSNPSLRNRLTELSLEINDLYAQIERLEAERRSIVTALDAIVYPILSLPADITTEIFAHYFDDLLDDGGKWGELQIPLFNLERARHVGPFCLSHVCRAWRSIAVEMPSLWNRIRATSLQENAPGPDWRKLLDCWLSRTGSRMLYLDLVGSHYRDVQTRLLFPSIASYSPRWRVLGCYLNTPILFPIDTIRGRIPLLRELDIRRQDDAPGDRITAFSEAPELRKVQLHHLPLDSISLPWAQLTHLTLYGQSIACAIEVLHQTPNLVELSLDLCHRPDEAPPTPVILHHVRKLSLSDGFQLSKFIHYLTLPRLTTFDISYFGESPVQDSDGAALLAFFRLSNCVVESVVCSTSPRYEAMALSILATTDMASKVTIHANWYSSALSNLFARIATKPTFLPNLESLYLPDCQTDIPFVELADMLSARWYNRGNAPRLKTFHLTRTAGAVDHTPDASAVAKIRALMNDGVDIRIETTIKHTSEYPFLLTKNSRR